VHGLGFRTQGASRLDGVDEVRHFRDAVPVELQARQTRNAFGQAVGRFRAAPMQARLRARRRLTDRPPRAISRPSWEQIETRALLAVT
jgi:hypothetical protein